MGSPDTPEQKPTQQEIAQFEIATKQWQNYQENAPKTQEEYMRLTSGRVPDGEGGLSIVENGLLNQDGTIRADTGQQMAQAGQQWQGLNKPVNPNRGNVRAGRLNLLNRKMGSDAGIETRNLLQQQNRPLRATENIIAMGRGQQGEALQGMQQLTGIAAQQAGADAQGAFADQSANRYLLGAGIGAVGGYYSYNYDQDKNKNGKKPANRTNLLSHFRGGV